MAVKPQNKWCIVPKCKNTSFRTPGKLFLYVPSNPVQRNKWFKAAMRDMKKSPISPKSCIYCCEDHFDLENDLDNYMRFKFYRAEGLTTHNRLKPGVIPHRFDCQERSNSTTGDPRSSVSEKEERKKLVSKLLSEADEAISSSLESLAGEEVFEPEVKIRVQSLPNAAVQVNLKPKFRSKATQVRPNVRHRGISPIHLFSKDSSTDIPIKRRRLDNGNESEPESTVRSPDGSDGVISITVKSIDTKSAQVQEVKMQRKKCLDTTVWKIERRSKCYNGLNEKSYSLVTVLSSQVGFSARDLLLMLRKLTLNEPFNCLGDYFGLSPSEAGKMFSRNIRRLASVMLLLVYWPDTSRIKRLLPIPFRHGYNKLQSIFDCFEVKIEKPANPTNQWATWSLNKQANTIKYLVSYTPNGFVSFISTGYGGRTTDATLTQKCGYLGHLEPGMEIMAYRGLKNFAFPLDQLGVSLVKLPRVPSSQKLQNHDEVKAAERIASLRTHVEKIIGRIQAFQFLSPGVCLDSKLAPLLDAAVIVIAGLINLQDPLFGQY